MIRFFFFFFFVVEVLEVLCDTCGEGKLILIQGILSKQCLLRILCRNNKIFYRVCYEAFRLVGWLVVFGLTAL